MKIVLFLVIITASAALSVGYLSAPTIDTVAQEVGIGENNSVFNTITQGAMSVKIERTFGVALSGTSVISAYKDKIVECVFRSTDRTIKDGSTLICKLTDGTDFATSKVIAEGRKIVTMDIGIGVPVTIPIINLISTTSNSPDNIQNIFFIVQDPPT